MEKISALGYGTERDTITNPLPVTLFQEGKALSHELFRLLQADLKAPASLLEFGCGEGGSIKLLAYHIDPRIIREICLYDIRDVKQTKFGHRIMKKFENVYFTTQKPKEEQFDVVHMSFVANLGLEAITEAVMALKPKGYLLLFDYDMKGASIGEMFELCRTDVEQRLMKEHGFEGFYRKTAQYGLSDYDSKFKQQGIEVIFSQKIPPKFCVLAGKKH